MVRVLLLDGDRVVINKPELWSQHLMRDYGVLPHAVLPFFQNEFQLCLVGKADLKEEIQKYMPVWGWKKSVTELLDYWFRSEHFVDERLIAKVREYRGKGIACYLASNQEKYRTEYMRNQMGLGKEFDGIFSSAYIGTKKPEPGFWQAILEVVAPVQRDQVLLWDDEQENVDSAKAFGFQAKLYCGYDSFVKKMGQYGL